MTLRGCSAVRGEAGRTGGGAELLTPRYRPPVYARWILRLYADLEGSGHLPSYL